MSYGNFGTCKFCGAQIMWIKMSGGRIMPCNANIIDYVEVEGGREKIVRPDGCVVSGEIVDGSKYKPDGFGYISHFATCPKAGSARRK